LLSQNAKPDAAASSGQLIDYAIVSRETDFVTSRPDAPFAGSRAPGF